MKKIIGVLFLVAMAFAMMSCSNAVADFEGSTDAAGRTTYSCSTSDQLISAASNATAGDTINITANITLSKQLQFLKSGTSSKPITVNGNKYTINCSKYSGWGVKVNGSYINFKNFYVTKAQDCGMVFQSGGNNRCEYCKFTYNGDSGLQVYNAAHDVTVTGCESYYNYDSANGGENADGFAAKLSGGKNIKFNKCVAKYNSDDGWDLYGQPYQVTMNQCEASYNGYRDSSLTTTANGDGNGFKLGKSGQSVSHRVLTCTAKNNLAYGIDANGNTATMTITNCTVSGNKKGQISSRTSY